jgi:hypothetical protein
VGALGLCLHRCADRGICQVRSEDIKQITGIWCIAFAAEAGSLKNVNSERVVPVHSALIDEGFLKFVTSARRGPLFPDLAPDRFGSRGGTGTKILSRWIRSLGVVDKRISPNHSWRHRIKTLGRRNTLAVDILDAITGHARRTVADTYGDFYPDAMLRELGKIPPLERWDVARASSHVPSAVDVVGPFAGTALRPRCDEVHFDETGDTAQKTGDLALVDQG